eukprot:Rhum_TRINITY_DN2817_c0_g1::Rhum_TRINITY_DN2817_c0_g1_i1::g.8471::m.8471
MSGNAKPKTSSEPRHAALHPLLQYCPTAEAILARAVHDAVRLQPTEAVPFLERFNASAKRAVGSNRDRWCGPDRHASAKARQVLQAIDLVVQLVFRHEPSLAELEAVLGYTLNATPNTALRITYALRERARAEGSERYTPLLTAVQRDIDLHANVPRQIPLPSVVRLVHIFARSDCLERDFVAKAAERFAADKGVGLTEAEHALMLRAFERLGLAQHPAARTAAARLATAHATLQVEAGLKLAPEYSARQVAVQGLRGTPSHVVLALAELHSKRGSGGAQVLDAVAEHVAATGTRHFSHSELVRLATAARGGRAAAHAGLLSLMTAALRGSSNK